MVRGYVTLRLVANCWFSVSLKAVSTHIPLYSYTCGVSWPVTSSGLARTFSQLACFPTYPSFDQPTEHHAHSYG